MNDVIKTIVGGAIVLVIGGTAYTINQADITNIFAEETGMSQEEADKYVSELQDDLVSWTETGNNFVDYGNTSIQEASVIDCVNYEYGWVSPSLSCEEGKVQYDLMGRNELSLGECYRALDTDLGDRAGEKMEECVGKIDALNGSYESPISNALFEHDSISELKQTNIYNKSVLKAALESQN